MIDKRAPQWRRYWNLWTHLENPGSYLKRKLGLDSSEPARFVLTGGLRVNSPGIRLGEFKEITMDDAYLRGFRPTAWARDPASAMVVVDVGANLGFFSLYVKSRFPDCTVIGLEPLPGNFAFFRDNVAQNPGLGGSIRAVEAALAATSGTLKLGTHGGEFPTDATLWTERGQGTLFEVPALTLEDLLREHGIQEVTLLKMDCEGAEFDILYRADPAVLERVKAIALEVHRGPAREHTMESLGQFLAGRGFACGFGKRGGFLWAARDRGWLTSPDLPR